MSAATFTPGPWTVTHDLDSYYVVSGSVALAEVSRFSDDGGPTDTEQRANARLIAAAPELLEACKLFQAALTEYRLRDVKKRFSLCLADAAASNAIAKAEGSAD